MSDRLKKEVQHFQELSTSQAKRIEKLEEELIKHESLMEQRQVLLSESYQQNSLIYSAWHIAKMKESIGYHY